jgi:valyl-tRNA synthetase
MSKSLGNSPDPLELIEKFGADGVRVGMLLCSPAGGDLLFDESLPQQGAGFATKIWNAFRLVKNWNADESIPQPEHSRLALEWFHHKLHEVNTLLSDHFDKFRISDALMLIYTTFRDEFSGWLLEIVKPGYQQPIDGETFLEVTDLFDQLLRMMHPFIPFITEEIWQLLSPRKAGESIMITQMPVPCEYDVQLLEAFDQVKEAISGIRKIRLDNNIPARDLLEITVTPGDKGYVPQYETVMIKLCNTTPVLETEAETRGNVSFRVKSTNWHVILLQQADLQEELQKLSDELTYARNFLDSVNKKLANERFVSSAPEAIVDKEKAKKADAEAKIRVLEERIAVIKIKG